MNRNRLLPLAGLVIGFGLTLAGGTAALPEISPVWQAFYGLTPPFDPFADLDNDGWDFREESAAGTSPFSANAPDGFLIPNIRIHSELPSVVTVSFNLSLIGKRYRLMASTDLTEGSWFEAAEPAMGYGGPLEFRLDVSHEDGTQPPKLFFRIAVADVPSPSEAITGRSQWDDYMLSIHPGIDPNPGPNPPGDGTEPPPDLDSDALDSTVDAVDTDPLIRWRKTPDNSYLWIPVTNQGALRPIDCNDKGQLLFSASLEQISDLPTHPIGKIWDPAKPVSDRWTNLFFAPPSFKLNAIRHTGSEPEIFEHTVVFPFQSSDLLSYGFNITLRALGDDGSVLANAGYGFSERIDLETLTLSGSNQDLVFLWRGTNRTTPQLFDVGRGYTSDLARYTRNGSVGFYTDTTGAVPVVKALVLDQEMVTTSYSSVSELYLKILPIDGGPMVTRLMHHQREMHPSPADAGSSSGLTPNGRFIIANSRQLANGPPYRDLYYTSASAGGAAGRISVPRHTYDTVIDLPTGEWGLGNATGLVRVAQGDTNFATTTITGVVQFDKQGTGIGSGENNFHIWRNGSWITLRQATGRNDFPADVRPKKITASGIIWAGNESGTVNGILVPVALNLYKRGTINKPGPMIPRPATAQDIYEVVTLENADYDEFEAWVPNSMESAGEANRQDGTTSFVHPNRDDDFVKIHLQCPKIAGHVELVMIQPGQGIRMRADDLRFYTRDGTALALDGITVGDLLNPTGVARDIAGPNGMDLFVEIADLGQLTLREEVANANSRRYADLALRGEIGGIPFEQRVRIYRGGYWKNQRSGNTGTTAFYDGKGRYQDDNGNWQVGVGERVHGPFAIKSGQTGTTDSSVPNKGPTPLGWYGLFERTLFTRTWSGNSRPQLDHNTGPNGESLGYLQQGSYCQWAGNGDRIGQHVHGAYQHAGSNPPASIHFKFELVPTSAFTTRTYLQVHPDGFNDGTAGCVGLQGYADCCKIFFLMRHYFGTNIQVETP